MRIVFFLVTCIFCFMTTTTFAAFHENGIGEFYFGEPKEEIQQKYIFFDEKIDKEKTYYSIIVPSFDFYDVKIEQPISLGFKNNLLVTINFRTPYNKPEYLKALQKKLVTLAPENFSPLEFLVPEEAIFVKEDRLLSISYIDMRKFLPPLFISDDEDYTYLSIYMTKD